MITGTTSSGFSYEVEDEVLDDYEFLELLSKIDKGKNGLIVEMVDRFLGEKQKEKLKEHVRDENGRVSAVRLLGEVMEIFRSHGAGKN